MRRGDALLIALSAMLVMASFLSPKVFAVTSTSPNFQLDESSIGTGGLLNSESDSFRIFESTGDLGVGESSSTNFNIQAGSQTSPDPVLSVSVDNFDVDFTTFSPTEASTGEATFTVRNYTSWGYVVQIFGQPPKNDAYEIAAIDDVPTASQIGLEQFGINLVANTDPESIGANPDNGDFGFGQAELNFDESDKYYYTSGSIIASAPRSSGETQYTISYLVNVAGLTPGGQYSSNQTIVVTGTY